MLGFQKLINELDVNNEKKVVSIIGAGGKTTLMYALAEFYARAGRNVLVSTTTHIRKPDPSLLVENVSELRECWAEGKYGVAGQAVKGEKLKSLSEKMLDAYMDEAEVVLLEADGAKEFPCKVPNETEPVIVAETNVILMVLGLDALGKRMRDVCFRLELAMDLLEEDRDHSMTEEDFIMIVKNQLDHLRAQKVLDGSVQFLLILNKCETKKQEKQGNSILQALNKEENCFGFLTKLK
ncbi:MAG: selenium cofactor biosynthesis protein YqeC [Eubacteriales bacterium]